MSRPLKRGPRAGLRAVVAAAIVATATVSGSMPKAFAAPAISLTKSAPGSVRAGEPIGYTLTATNPSSNPDAAIEYNFSFRDVLPAGLTYVAGSTSPATAGDPVQSADAATGQTTLVWANLADLKPGQTFALGFQATPDPTEYPVGSTVTNRADLYANTDPFTSPAFDASGAIVPGTATETASATGPATLITALEIDKSEPSPEGELLRGVHDHPTVYTLTIRGSDVSPTSGLVVTDFLPATLEYLGCGGVDNSSAPEYPGAPSLAATPAVGGCTQPDSVSTVVDPPPDGTTTYPPGVYTRLQWTLATIAPGQVVVLNYAAGVPLRANAAWPGAQPDPAGLTQTANLDNNTGPSTREGPAEASATNIARVTGTYDGTTAPGSSSTVSADTSKTVSLEDVRMRKAVSPGSFSAGGVATYTLTIDTSEYVSGSDIVVTDTIPNGVCPLGGPGTNFTTTPPLPACAGSAATAPSVPYTSVTENADGTFTAVFAPVAVGPNGTTTITYSGAMLEFYQGGPLGGSPTSSGDSFTNHASLDATTTPIAGTGETGTATVTDDSQATQTTSVISMDKTVQPRSQATGTCPTDVSTFGHPADFPPSDTQFRIGDLICFALRVDFPAATVTRNFTVADDLPPGLQYVTGSAQAADSNRLAPFTVTEQPTSVIFNIGTPDAAGDRLVVQGAVFEVVLQARVTEAAPGADPDVRANLMKASGDNSSGASESFRDELDVEVVPAAPLGLVKGVQAVDSPPSGPNGVDSNVDGSLVHAGSVATFRIDVTHLGTAGTANGYPVGGIDVWDVLPAGVSCADIGNVRGDPAIPVAPAVTCTDPGAAGQPQFTGSSTLSLLRVTYPQDAGAGIDARLLHAGATLTILYDLTVPPPAGVSTVYTDTASVHSYQAPNDVAGTASTYFPKDNVDLSIPVAEQNAPAASDSSNVRTPGPVVAKSGTTSITEAGNDTPTQATIGEQVTYTYSVTIPADTSIFGAALDDTLPSGFTIVPNATLAFFPDAASPATAPVPPGIAVDGTTGRVTFPATYANATATDQRVEVTVVTLVTGAALPTGQNAVDAVNTARFTSLTAPGGNALPAATAGYTVNLRQPDPALTKTNDQPTPVPGGTVVTYTLTATNPDPGGDRPPLHDAFIVDCVPVGMTFQAYGPNPGETPGTGDGTNGCAAGTTRLVWNLADIAPGATVVRTYTAALPADAVAGTTYTNTAMLTGSTLGDGKTDPLAPDNPNERGYAVPSTSSVAIIGADIRKSVTPDHATIGDRVTWQVEAAVPANTVFFDGAVIDDVPAGITNTTLDSMVCTVLSTPAASCSTVGTQLTPIPQPDGSTLFGWLAGDLAPNANVRQLLITYSGTIADVPVNTAGRLATNTAHTAWDTTDGRTPTSADFAYDTTSPNVSATVTVIEPSVTITKAVSDPTPGPTDPFTYRLTVTNSSAVNTSAAFDGRITDAVPPGVVVNPATISASGVLTGGDPVKGGGTITWSGPAVAGPLGPGQTLDLTYGAVLAPSAQLSGSALTNTADLASYASLPTGGRVYAGNTTTAMVTPAFPLLQTTKTAVDPAPTYIGAAFTWQVTVTNAGGAPAFGVDVTDTLPPNWTYRLASTTISVAGGAPAMTDPLVVGPVLRWSNVGVLQPGQAAVVTFQATPTPAVVTNPGVGSTVAHINTAAGSGADASGASANASGSYSAGPATAQTRIDSADLAVAKTHTDPVVAGSNANWSVLVTNNGADTAVGPFGVTDTLPAGVGFVSATGTGWACSATAGTVTCSRLDPAEVLAPGASLPPIAIVTSVPATTPSGTQITNTASASDRTFDPNPANNTSTDVATVTTSADLSVTKTHSGAVVAGQDITWTLDVANNGPSVAQPVTTVTDTLPPGTTFVSATGTGWTCAGAAQSLTCTRGDVLALGPLPQITVVALIGPDVTGTITNTAHVSGPTPDPTPGNNTATDTATVDTSADLSIQKSHTGTFRAGTDDVYNLVVTNNGPSVAQAPVRITDTLPTGLSYVSSTDVTGTWTCTAALQVVTCDLAGPLAVGAQAEVAITVAVDPDLGSGSFLNTANVSSPTPDPNPANNTDTDNTEFDSAADLQVQKTHTGNAVAGGLLNWTIVATNNGPSSSPGPIVVTDALPPTTIFVSATGTGWVCAAAGQIVTCTSAGSLAVGASPPPITLTVRVKTDAGPSIITNLVSVDGPITDPKPINNADTDSVTVTDQADVAIVKDVVGSTTVDAGNNVTFNLTVSNNGPSDADAVVVSDTLPPGLTPVSVTPPPADGWTCVTVSSTITCRRTTFPAALPPAAAPTSVIVAVAHVDPGTPSGTQLTNTATVATSSPGDDPANDTDSAIVTVTTDADLSIIKTHDNRADPVTAGTPVTFDITVTNEGPSNALAPLTVVDTLPEGMSFVAAADPWRCTVGADPLVITCVLPGGAPLEAGAKAPELLITVETATNDSGTYTNNASVTSPTPDPDPPGANTTDHLPVIQIANLAITKTHTGEAHIGDDLTFTLQVSNAGPSQAQDVVVTDTLPRGLSFVSAGTSAVLPSAPRWVCPPPGVDTVTCTLEDGSGTNVGLDAQATAPPLPVVVTVGTAAYPSAENKATVATSTGERQLTDNTATDIVDVPPVVDLSVTKSHTGAFVVGQPALWQITVSNAGPTPDPGPITVTDQLPPGISFVSAAGNGWTCAASGATVTCTSPAGLGVRQSSQIQLTVAVGAAAFPSVVNTVGVSSPAEDIDPSNNTATDPADIVPISMLSIVKQRIAQDGDQDTFAIRVTNKGPNATTAPITVVDQLPAGMNLISATGAGWTCMTVQSTITCNYAANLAVGATTSDLIVVVTLTSAPGVDLINTATASGGQPSPCPECGSTDTADASVPNPPVVAATQDAVTDASSGLAFTGAKVAGTSLLGLALIGAGLLLVGSKRRRRHRS